MRLRAKIMVEGDGLPKDYRRCFLSLLKSALSLYEGGAYFDEFFGRPKEKPYCFSVQFPKGAQYTRDKVILPQGTAWLTISTGDMRTGVILSNVMLEMALRKVRHGMAQGRAMTVEDVQLEEEPVIAGDRMVVQFMSPLCLREHFRGRDDGVKDIYYTIGRPEFEARFKESAQRLLGCGEVQIVPLQMREMFVLHYGAIIPCTLGTAVILGKSDDLQTMLTNGVGSRRNSGFGLFRILNKKEVARLCRNFA